MLLSAFYLYTGGGEGLHTFQGVAHTSLPSCYSLVDCVISPAITRLDIEKNLQVGKLSD